MRRSLTLVELLLVVFILAAVAASAATLTDDVDVQARYDVTISRRDLVREAILGQSEVGGQRLVSGFVADMGRLPRSLRELIQPLDETGGALQKWVYDPAREVGAGWRGPYLPIRFEDATPVFRDGWGNRSGADDALNYGWDVSNATPDRFEIRSLGRDNLVGGVELYDKDLPADHGDPTLYLVSSNDWQIDISGLKVPLRLVNDGADITNDLELRILIPNQDGSFPETADWPTPMAFRSDPKSEDILAGATEDLLFEFPGASRLLPAGAWAMEVVDATTGVRLTKGVGVKIQLQARSELPPIPGLTPPDLVDFDEAHTMTLESP